MRIQRKVEFIFSNSSMKSFNVFTEILEKSKKFQFIDFKLNQINTNSKSILESMHKINLKYIKIVSTLSKQQISNLIRNMDQPIESRHNLDYVPSTMYCSINQKESSDSSPHENLETMSRHMSKVPSKFQRVSEEERVSIMKHLENFEFSQKNNFISSFTKTNNFMDLAFSPKKLQKESKIKYGKMKKEKSTNSMKGREEERKPSSEIRKIMKEFKRKNEERSATNLDYCKNSENRLLSSLSRK